MSFILDESKLTYNKSCISKNSCVSKKDDIMNFDGNILHKKLSNSGYSLGIAKKKYPIPVLRLFNYLVFPSFDFFGLCLLSFFSLFCRTLCCMSSFILRLLTDYLFGILDVWFVFTCSCLKIAPSVFSGIYSKLFDCHSCSFICSHSNSLYTAMTTYTS